MSASADGDARVSFRASGGCEKTLCRPVRNIADVGELVVERAGVDAGMRVLDVACGTGNAALPAARAGAHVTDLDLVPELLDAGREKAAAVGVAKSDAPSGQK